MSTKLMTPSNLKGVRFHVSGLDEYLKKIKEAGANVDEIVAKAVEESGHPIYEDILIWAKKHKDTGETLEGVTITKVQREGNRFYIDVGIDTTKAKTAWHAVFVEYGTPTNVADPGIRNAFSQNKKNVIKIQKGILEKAGIPVG